MKWDNSKTDPHLAALVDEEGFTICTIKTPNANAAQVAKKLWATRECLAQAILVIEDFMPNIGKCVLQDYGRLNDVLRNSKELLKDLT